MSSSRLAECARDGRRSIAATLIAGLVLTVTSPSFAQDVVARAESIKQWRTDCTDPDADVRFAYVEAAIASDDAVVQRTCLKLALDDEDVEIRRLAVQLALVMNDRVVLRFRPSDELEAALEEAVKKRDDVDEVRKRFGETADVLARTEGVLTLAPIDVSLQDQVSSWHMLQPNGVASDNYVLDMTLIGDRLTGSGKMHDGSYSRTVNLTLVLSDEGALEGSIAFDGGLEFPLSARLY